MSCHGVLIEISVQNSAFQDLVGATRLKNDSRNTKTKFNQGWLVYDYVYNNVTFMYIFIGCCCDLLEDKCTDYVTNVV